MKKILITRPLNQALHTVKSLQEIGLEAIAEPLLNLKKMPHSVSDYALYKQFVVTSGNSFDFWDLDDVDRNIPLIAVGPQTAERAKACGFTDITNASGMARDIQNHLKPEKTLHIGGYHISHTLGAHVDRLIVYEAMAIKTLRKRIKTAFENGDIGLVTFYSTRTAKIFSQLIESEKMAKELEKTEVLSISNKVIRSVRVFPWARTHTAQAPNGTAMIEACKRIVKNES